MLILLLSLLFLALFALALGFVLQKRGKTEDAAPAKPRPEGCCGMHEVCEKESLLDGIDYEAEYYDDDSLVDPHDVHESVMTKIFKNISPKLHAMVDRLKEKKANKSKDTNNDDKKGKEQ